MQKFTVAFIRWVDQGTNDPEQAMRFPGVDFVRVREVLRTERGQALLDGLLENEGKGLSGLQREVFDLVKNDPRLSGLLSNPDNRDDTLALTTKRHVEDALVGLLNAAIQAGENKGSPRLRLIDQALGAIPSFTKAVTHALIKHARSFPLPDQSHGEEPTAIQDKQTPSELIGVYIRLPGGAIGDAVALSENATRVPLTQSGFEEMLDFNKRATDLLSKFRDDIAYQMITERIGRAQRRFGVGPGRESPHFAYQPDPPQEGKKAGYGEGKSETWTSDAFGLVNVTKSALGGEVTVRAQVDGRRRTYTQRTEDGAWDPEIGPPRGLLREVEERVPSWLFKASALSGLSDLPPGWSWEEPRRGGPPIRVRPFPGGVVEVIEDAGFGRERDGYRVIARGGGKFHSIGPEGQVSTQNHHRFTTPQAAIRAAELYVKRAQHAKQKPGEGGLPSFSSAESMVEAIRTRLRPLYQGFRFNVYVERIVGLSHVSVDFFRVPPGASDLDTWNSSAYIKITINARGSAVWKAGDPAPVEAEATMARILGVPPFRKVSGPTDRVVSKVIAYFESNRVALQG